MKKCFSCLVVALLASLSVFAQSSEQLTKIINSEKVTCAQASYLAALYANRIAEEDSAEQAFNALKDAGCFDQNAAADSEITLGQLSYAYTRALGIRGGLFFTLFPSQRYAFKELKAQGVLPTESDPSMAVSGRESLDLFNSCLSLAGGDE